MASNFSETLVFRDAGRSAGQVGQPPYTKSCSPFPSEVARNEVIDGLYGGIGSIDTCEEDLDMRQTHRDWAAKWAMKKVQTSSASASSKRCAKEEVALDAQYLREAATEFQAEWAGSEERKMTTMFAHMMWSIPNPSE